MAFLASVLFGIIKTTSRHNYLVGVIANFGQMLMDRMGALLVGVIAISRLLCLEMINEYGLESIIHSQGVSDC